MSIKLGSTNFSSIYLGSTKIGSAYLGSVKVYGPSQPVLPSHTFRCKFSTGYTPTMGTTQTLVDASENIWDIYRSSNDWQSLFYNSSNLLSVIAANTTGITNMNSLFDSCSNLTSVSIFDTRSVTDMGFMFLECTNLSSVPLFDTSSVTNMETMFQSCSRLTSVPLFNTSSVKKMSAMFAGCSSLTAIPLFNTSSATNMNVMFDDCVAVESGALALYTQASTQANPPTSHAYTFQNCGTNTVTGAAELSQIPSSWGGTGP